MAINKGNKGQEANLKVVEALQDDVYKGVARVDPNLMKALGLERGDIISIKGGRQSVAIVDRAYPADVGERIIRIDGLIRKNVKTGVGEQVIVKKADVKGATKVSIAPVQQGISVQADPEMFKHALLGRPVVKGDILSLGGQRRKTDFTGEGFPDIFSDFQDLFGQGFGFSGFQQLRFVVTNTTPNQACFIDENTEIMLNSKAVEVSEDVLPEITYEDVGGLTEEVKKVREMVELPLKHPEIFDKLGIEPPKGVILHGSPGTGKTLLAKAVANETESNFILLNGPEIMCVGGETPILTNPSGYVKAEEIYKKEGKSENIGKYDVKKLDAPISTFSYKDGKIEKAQITHVTKLIADAYKIKLSDGNEISVSENQPFLVYRNGELVWEVTGKIKKGDFVVRLNKVEMDEESWDVPVKELNRKFKLEEKNGKFTIKSKNLSRSTFINLPEKTSSWLLEFLGLLVSDGNISNKMDSIGFYNKDKDLIERFKHLANRVFGVDEFKEKNQGKNFGVIVYSKLLVEYLKLIGFTNENKENIPYYFFKLPKNEIGAFVRGYFDGDGTVSKLKIKGMSYPTPILYSIKREFLSQLQSLILLKLEISCKLQEHKTSKGMMYKLVVRGNEGRQKFLKIGAVSNHKLKALKEIEKVIRIKEHENIPHPSLLIEEIKKLPYKEYKNKDYYVYKTGKATKHSLNVLYNLAVQNGLANNTIKNEFALLSRDDIGWEQVVGISQEGKKELYDFTVDKDSFTAAPYFLMHNSKFYGESEKKIRDIFEDAEKNAPSIIFIDEIDAIAPKREDVQGEVERRVVSQILTLMDGLKSRGRVVVIGATNRINSLDPALRRPGRFDREISINVPDKAGRLNILKIHTRNMPLFKDVDLKVLASKTHGFVGADLNALTKEAAMIVLRKFLPELKLEEGEAIPPEVLDKIVIAGSDFEEALKVVRPSAMREVLVETPNIGWNDIGGLEKTKEALQEAVEWPIKNPEGFKRLGIRAPRGVLLYGSPGTGKTLLAKAVAKESEANFINVKGPSLLSMWVGKSLPYDEELIVRENGVVKRVKIGEIVEKKLDVEVLAFDKDKRIGFSDVKDFIKHEMDDQMLEITTKTGRKIRVTKEHSLFSFVNGKFGDISAGHILPDESFIAIPKNLNLPREKIREFNLYESFKNDEEIFVSNVVEYLDKAKKLVGLDETSKVLGLSKKYLAEVTGKDLPVSIKKFEELIKLSGLSLNFSKIKIKLKGSKHSYPAIFKVDKDFWRLLGVWIAEGDFNSSCVRIHNQNEEIRKDIFEICKKYNFKISENKDTIFISSYFLQKVFENVFGLETGAAKKKLPLLAFILDKKAKSELLKGYFSGDGSIYSLEGDKYRIEASTISKKLANDLLYLLLDFGIVSSYREKKLQSGNVGHMITIFGVNNFDRFREIGFIDQIRNRMIGKYINLKKWARSDLIPLSGELAQLASKSSSVYKRNESIGKEKLRQVLISVDRDRTKYPEYWDLVEGDIYFDLVKEVKLVDSENFVYDVSVDGENFVAGFGGVLAHNSEEGVRKVFERARQVSPCVIFFDEIDALAGRRGYDSGTKVTERVLNQLLSEMDGLEDLKDVTVIAATNRPDMLDPALLRPGRFDRIILVDVPDKESREKIFEVHLKNTPLGKDVKIKDLVMKTEGFVGADIESLVREASMNALRSDSGAKEVTRKDFDEAFKKTKPSVSEESAKRYKKIEEYYLKNAKAGGIEFGPVYTG